MKCLLTDIKASRQESKISGTSAVNSWTKPGATCSNLIDRAGFAATC